MAEHPIQGLMTTAMENLKEMVDVNTIIGDPVETPDGSVVIPVSRVGFGYAAGGSQFNGTKESGKGISSGGTSEDGKQNGGAKLPFGGGSGGGVSITPVAFLVISSKGIKLLNMDGQTHLYDRLLDAAPQVLERLQGMVRGKRSESKPEIDPPNVNI